MFLQQWGNNCETHVWTAGTWATGCCTHSARQVCLASLLLCHCEFIFMCLHCWSSDSLSQTCWQGSEGKQPCVPTSFYIRGFPGLSHHYLPAKQQHYVLSEACLLRGSSTSWWASMRKYLKYILAMYVYAFEGQSAELCSLKLPLLCLWYASRRFVEACIQGNK
jgi:hypothetical protein